MFYKLVSDDSLVMMNNVDDRNNVTSVLPILLLVTYVSTQCLTGNDSPRTMNVGSKKAVINSRFEFALDTLKKMSQIESRDNIFYSPQSLHQALTLAYFGARGTTENSLKKALHISADLSKVDVQRYYAYENSFKKPDDQQNSSADYEYNSANRLWISDTRKVRECMLDLFGDQLEKTDFHTNPNAVRDYINQWVSNETKGHIRDLLPPTSITENTDLVLVNAVYFKGRWKNRFDSANSKKDIFYSSNSQHSMVTFMKQKGNFNHRSAELRTLLDMGIPPEQVEVILPRFEVEKELEISTLLHAIGAGDLVTPNAADLRGFTEDGEKPLHLGDAVHRARIEVTEEGTTAAAATALYTWRSGRPLQPAVFNANHPFLYFIYEKSTRNILFSGIYRSPNPANASS
ncbi:Antithrombin-III [Melipona quadrifasciata]|uniref:Antithrombin-III n=1 Tax=Melipona quadrifasciata TaxID=166423 RepID=A0A0N0BIR9_9HYME|nr:Antithrombin-III [Melipona quadrifasciata]